MSLIQQVRDRLAKRQTKLKASVLGLEHSYPNYVISFAPFERKLLAAIASEFPLVSLDDVDDVDGVLSNLFYHWDVVINTWEAIEGMKEYLNESRAFVGG